VRWQIAFWRRRRLLKRKSTGQQPKSGKDSGIESGWQESSKNSETEGRRQEGGKNYCQELRGVVMVTAQTRDYWTPKGRSVLNFQAFEVIIPPGSHFGGFHDCGDGVALLKFESSALRRVIALSMRLSPTQTTTWAMMSPN
jgi:hypothetical protein